MATTVIVAGGHDFHVEYSLWNGWEKVTCDGAIVSAKRSFGLMMSHTFTMVEHGENVRYDLRSLGPVGHVAWRNGVVVSDRDRPVFGYLGAFVLIALAGEAVTAVVGFAAGLSGSLALHSALADDIDSASVAAALILAFPVAAIIKRRLRRLPTENAFADIR